jgi:hypothetical protein
MNPSYAYPRHAVVCTPVHEQCSTFLHAVGRQRNVTANERQPYGVLTEWLKSAQFRFDWLTAWEQSLSWEDSSGSPSQEIPRILWNPNIITVSTTTLHILRLSVTFRKKMFFTARSITPFRLSGTAYSVYSQLSSTCGEPTPPPATRGLMASVEK